MGLSVTSFLVLEKYPNTPMSHKEILQVIQREGLKEISGTSPLACLNAMLHTNSRGEEGIFYKVPGRMGVYTLKKDNSGNEKVLCEEDSEDSRDRHSNNQITKKNSNKDSKKSKWKRKVPSKLQSQPPSPQSRCPSPSVPASKVISPSQKHSKKALKQALKQQQQKNQKNRRQGGMPASSNSRLILKAVKDMGDKTASKPKPIKRAKCAEIDVETPDSILVNTNLRALINKHNFSILSPECQQHLLKLLPEVDQQASGDGVLKLNSSALNNEFFTSAAQSWKERLAEGEFTPEMRLRLRQEIEKEKKMEQWKEQFFESYFGENSGLSLDESIKLTRELESPEDTTAPTVVSEKESIRKTEAKIESVEDPKVKANNVNITEFKKEEKTTFPETAEILKSATTNNECNDAKSVSTPEDHEKKLEPPGETLISNNTPVVDTLEEPVKNNDAENESKDDKTFQDVVQHPEEKLEDRSLAQSQETEQMEVPQDRLKRKSPRVEEDSESSPEKVPRVMEPQPLQTPHISFQDKEQPSEQRVPPLKISVSRIFPTAAPGCQVSPRAQFHAHTISPGRTGARTLADIKAKAQLAKAQRAAAAAAAAAAAKASAAGGAVPGPGPGGGGSENDRVCQSGTKKEVAMELGGSGGRGDTRGVLFSSPESTNKELSVTENQFRTQLQQVSISGSNMVLQSPKNTTVIKSEVGRPSKEAQEKTLLTSLKQTPSEKEMSALPESTSSNCNHLKEQTKELFDKSDTLRTHTQIRTVGQRTDIHTNEVPPNTDIAIGTIKASPFGCQSLSTHITMEKTKNDVSITDKLKCSPQADNPVPTGPSPIISKQMTSVVNSSHTAHFVKASSSIPANNPLVTKLLQGKEVPLEQILPKPLTKINIKPVVVNSQDNDETFKPTTAVVSLENTEFSSRILPELFGRTLTQQRAFGLSQARAGIVEPRTASSEHGTYQHELLSKSTKDQILQTLIQNNQYQQFIPVSQASQQGICHINYPMDDCSSNQRFSLGLPGCKRNSKPAMSGHYLLNISTYGRGSEAIRRAYLGTIENQLKLNAPCTTLKNELSEGEVVTMENEAQLTLETTNDLRTDQLHLTAIKSEIQETPGIMPYMKSSHSLNQTFTPKVKVEDTFQDQVTEGQEDSSLTPTTTDVTAKESKQVVQLQAVQSDSKIRIQRNSDLYRLPGSLAFHRQKGKLHDNPATLLASTYGGTINMASSRVLNHSSTGPAHSPVYSPESSGGGSVMSFSVTVTTIPASHTLDHGDHGEATPTFGETAGLEDSPSKCYCRLKAMIMCKGCGAFCHDDCIGPSKLCVSCLVVR
uniref:ASXL transcriptional regulator 2 n=1 Tax=Erpetoichthys calabaricus TaxID=27687 RepID=A0A8C4RJ25_ERPCA